MKIEQFLEDLKIDPYMTVVKTTKDDIEGYRIYNKQYNTNTFISNEAIEMNDSPILLTCIQHGKNVDVITRITGYFTRTSSWNKGKKGELKDRHKTSV